MTRFALAAAMILSLAASSSAAIVGYWRMEVDNDPSANGLSVPNEIVSGSPLTSTTATIAGPVPTSPVPLTGAPNLSALDGQLDINGTIANYPALSVNSITIELFARSTESAATLFNRTSGTAGIIIDQAQNIRVRYGVDDGLGGITQVTLVGTTPIQLTTNWSHFAFTYDAVTGTGTLWQNGIARATNTGAPNRNLMWAGATDLLVGTGYDGGTTNGAGGNFDELRISDVALAPSEFLNYTPIPEPGTLAGLGCSAIFYLTIQAARKRSKPQ